MKIACAPLALALLLHASAARAFIIEPTLAEAAKRADLVVIAKPVKLEPVGVSYSMAYELATFELTRVLASNESQLRAIGWYGRPRICVFRLAKTHEIHFEPQELRLGTPYILVVNRLVPDGSYSPLSSYYPILPATEENVRAMRQALYGTEEERFAPEELPLDAAEALVVAVHLDARGEVPAPDRVHRALEARERPNDAQDEEEREERRRRADRREREPRRPPLSGEPHAEALARALRLADLDREGLVAELLEPREEALLALRGREVGRIRRINGAEQRLLLLEVARQEVPELGDDRPLAVGVRRGPQRLEGRAQPVGLGFERPLPRGIVRSRVAHRLAVAPRERLRERARRAQPRDVLPEPLARALRLHGVHEDRRRVHAERREPGEDEEDEPPDERARAVARRLRRAHGRASAPGARRRNRSPSRAARPSATSFSSWPKAETRASGRSEGSTAPA